MSYESGPYRVSRVLLARPDFRTACETRDFRMAFRLMKKYDGASQNRIASPVEGLSQSRVSRIMQGEDHIARLSLIERIADALRIPGAYFHLAARPWEATGEPGDGVPRSRGAGARPAGPGGEVSPPPAASASPIAAAAPVESSRTARGGPDSGVLVVEEDRAELRYEDGMYVAHQRRRVLNTGIEPVTRYLMRISVDRFPGDQ